MWRNCCSTPRPETAKRVHIGFGQDPGQAGKSQKLHLVRALSAFTVQPAVESGDKLTRFGPFSSQCRAGNVKILRGFWYEDLFRVLEGFPDLAHDDEVDACSGALEMLNPNMKGWGAYELARRQAEQLRERKAREAAAQPAQPAWAPGSMEWKAEQEKLKGGALMQSPLCKSKRSTRRAQALARAHSIEGLFVSSPGGYADRPSRAGDRVR